MMRRATIVGCVVLSVLAQGCGSDAPSAGSSPEKEPGVALSSSSLTFGNTVIGSSSVAQSVTLTNNGNAILTITSIALGGTNPGAFSETSNCGSSLSAGSTCSVSVVFSPQAATTFGASLNIADNASGSSQVVFLSGTGVVSPAPLASLYPAVLTFPNTPLGSTSSVQSATLSNTGTAALTIGSILLGGPNPGDFNESNTCTGSLAAGSYCTINVNFIPQSANTFNASVTVTDNATGSPQVLALSGIGAPVASITSVQLVCVPAQITPLNTSNCTPTVTGQGNYSSAVTWTTNVGQVNNGSFNPIGVERATITATSVEDPTKSGSFVVVSDIQWTPGTLLWGADGQLPIGVYYEIPLSSSTPNGPSQIADLKTVFGTTLNTIMYRAWNYESGVTSGDLATAQNNGIIPLVGFATYPDYSTPCPSGSLQPGWKNWYALNTGGEQEAYRWAYCRATQGAGIDSTVSTNLYWYVGNEWLGDNWPLLPTACQVTVTGTTPAAWESVTSGNPCYPLFRGAMAGSIAGLQDAFGYVRIVPGVNGANGNEGLIAALAADLAVASQNKSGRSLAWDFTSMHWGSDAANDQLSGNYFAEGPPDDYLFSNMSAAIDRNYFATAGIPGKPVIVTEISSSDGQNPSFTGTMNATYAAGNDALAAGQLTSLMDNLKVHSIAANGEAGVVGGLMYELYQQPVDTSVGLATGSATIDRFLYTHQPATNYGTISPQGKAVQRWILNNQNPTVTSVPIFKIALSMTSSTTINIGGTVSTTLSLTPSTFSGSVSLLYSAWAIQPNTPSVLPLCTFSNASLTASASVKMTCTAQSGLSSGPYVVNIYGANGSAVVPTNLTFTVQ